MLLCICLWRTSLVVVHYYCGWISIWVGVNDGVIRARVRECSLKDCCVLLQRWDVIIIKLFCIVMVVKVEDDNDNNVALEAIAVLLEEVARMVRQLKCRKPPASKGNVLRVGCHVKVVCSQGKYMGRTGKVVSQKGSMFWNVRLDASCKDPERLVFKMDSSLRAMEPNE
jgi:hypothetical protein